MTDMDLTESDPDFDGDDSVESEEILEAVEQAIDAILDQELDLEDPGDLEQVRKQLPTDPRAARIVDRLLPEPLQQTFEYVPATSAYDAFWRRSKDKWNPEEWTEAELEARIAFGEAAKETRGLEGTTTTIDGREISKSAAQVGDRMRGAQFTDRAEPTPAEKNRQDARGEQHLERLRELLE